MCIYMVNTPLCVYTRHKKPISGYDAKHRKSNVPDEEKSSTEQF